MRTARYTAGAETDLLKQAAWYEERQRGLGDRMMAAVERSLALAGAQPLGGRPDQRGARRYRVKGFPLSLVYRLEDEVLVVIALPHVRRMPGYWESR